MTAERVFISLKAEEHWLMPIISPKKRKIVSITRPFL
jgi:hypothetical protein